MITVERSFSAEFHWLIFKLIVKKLKLTGSFSGIIICISHKVMIRYIQSCFLFQNVPFMKLYWIFLFSYLISSLGGRSEIVGIYWVLTVQCPAGPEFSLSALDKRERPPPPPPVSWLTPNMNQTDVFDQMFATEDRNQSQVLFQFYSCKYTALTTYSAFP